MNIVWAAATVFGLGALHSLEPGHGKGVLSAYLVSARAKPLDAVWLGLVSAVAHTLSIAVLSFAALSAAQTFVPQRLTIWVELLSGLLIVWIGARLLLGQRSSRTVTVGKLGHRHTESYDHHHHHGHAHHHADHDQPPVSWHRLATVGFLAGIVPCPSAIAILLAAVGSQQTTIGLGLVAAFSAGSALTMCTIGILVVQTSRYVQSLEKRTLLQAASSLSSTLIVILGCAVALKSLLQLA